jgi:predicted NACHT family NTPase
MPKIIFWGVTYTSSLQEYISQELRTCDVAAADVESLFKNGRALILLDGLDEVSEQDSEAVRRQITQLCERYFKNQFAITCRTQAQKYRFEGFAYVEVADFNQEQIEDFAKKWFVAVAKNSEQKGLDRATEFIGKLKQLENKRVRALTITPILLSLTCL